MSLTGLLLLIAGSWVVASVLVVAAFSFIAGHFKARSHIHRGTRARLARSRIQLRIRDRKQS